jgi:hypothetical protein
VKRWIVTVGVLVAVVFAGVASARTRTSPEPGPIAPIGILEKSNAIALLSDSSAGAQSALTLKLHGELQCGRLQSHAFVVHLPAAMTVPDSIARAGATLGGVLPLRVSVKAHAVTLTAPPRRGPICNILGPGWFSIAFKDGAHLANPASAGTYRFSVAGLPGGRWNGTLAVH